MLEVLRKAWNGLGRGNEVSKPNEDACDANLQKGKPLHIPVFGA